jgi:hypothetical protein
MAEKMKGVETCRELTTELIRIVNLSKGLSRSWHDFDRFFRAEHLDNIREHARDLLDAKKLPEKEHDDFAALLDTFQRYNEGEGTVHNKEMLYEKALDLAAKAICGSCCSDQKGSG